MGNERTRRERRVARKHGGKARPASGAFWGLKRDVRSAGEFLMEHKDTQAKTYRFDVRDFILLEKQCSDPLPIYLIEFEGRGALYVLPDWVSEEHRKIITTKYFSVKLDPVEHRNVRIAFTNSNKKVLAVGYDRFQEICKELDVRT